MKCVEWDDTTPIGTETDTYRIILKNLAKATPTE